MSDSSSESSDDDVGKLIARTKQKYAKRPREEEQNESSGDDDDSASADENDAKVLDKDGGGSSDDDDRFVANNEVSSKLEELEQRRRIRERSNMLRQAAKDDDDDNSSSSSSDDDDEDFKPSAAASKAAVGGIVDKHKLRVTVKVCREEDLVEVLSSDDDDDVVQRQQRRIACSASKELQAIQAAREQLTSAQRYKAKIPVASPSLSPKGMRNLAAIAELTLTVHCKLMLHGKVQSNKTVTLTTCNTATLAQVQEELLKACELNQNAAIVSTLTFDNQVLGKSASALAKTLTAACPTIKSGSFLHATLHLTGLQSTARESALELQELEKKKFGRYMKVCLRRILDRKEDREEWSIREREPFSNLLARYGEKHKIQVVFKFDGETIGPNATAHKYDMEDGDLIDVVVTE